MWLDGWQWASFADRYFPLIVKGSELQCVTNLDSTLKSRHYFANKGLSSQSYGFSSGHVWMWGWTVKTAEHRRIVAFELWCWRRLLRVPWTAKSNQSILKEIKAEPPVLWPPDAKSWLIGKTLILGKIESRRRREWQRMRSLEGITESMDMSLSKLQQQARWWRTGKPGVLQSMGLQIVRHN